MLLHLRRAAVLVKGRCCVVSGTGGTKRERRKRGRSTGGANDDAPCIAPRLGLGDPPTTLPPALIGWGRARDVGLRCHDCFGRDPDTQAAIQLRPAIVAAPGRMPQPQSIKHTAHPVSSQQPLAGGCCSTAVSTTAANEKFHGSHG